MVNLDPLFMPATVAVIGASSSPGKWGSLVLSHLVTGGFPGPIYPVNPGSKEILGLKSFATVQEVPGYVDLAVITLPAPAVVPVLLDCAKKEVKACLVISAGFAELSEEGKQLQEKIKQIASEFQIKVVGPNTNGIWSFPSGLNTAFDRPPEPGPIAFLSQSGTFGIALSNLAARKGYGINYFVHLGNQADLVLADYLDYFSEQNSAQVIVCYIEGIGDGKRFLESARRTAKKKPVIVFRGGRTPAGKRAALSHTASVAHDDDIFSGMCRQVGLLEAQEPFHSFEMAYALASQPLPRGPNVAIVSGGGGFCVATSDACTKVGLKLPLLDEKARGDIKHVLSTVAPEPENPIDLAGDMRPEIYSQVIDMVGRLDYIHGILATTPFWLPLQYRSADSIKTLVDAIDLLTRVLKDIKKPFIIVQTSDIRGNPVAALVKEQKIPIYETPAASARAMHALLTYAKYVGACRSPLG